MKKIYTTEITGKYKNYPESDLTNKIIKSAINVHKILGCGFLEKIYENALKEELKNNKIQY